LCFFLEGLVTHTLTHVESYAAAHIWF
jgi:hypothetical protein